MSTYYYRDGQLYITKTMCNLVQAWQQECRVYPDEARRLKIGYRYGKTGDPTPMTWDEYWQGGTA